MDSSSFPKLKHSLIPDVSLEFITPSEIWKKYGIGKKPHTHSFFYSDVLIEE